MAAPKVTALNWTPELVARFEASNANNPWGVLEVPGEVLHGSFLFNVEHGAQRALMAVRPQVCTHGTRAEITGLVSEGPLFHAKAIDTAALMVAHQVNANVLAMCTRLPALVRAAERVGWVATGTIVTKRLGH